MADSFGRGAMTNHWTDIQFADVVLIIGANAAENHPISFRWVTKAMEKGAKLIVVDPRFTRSASKANIYAPLRPGTDIAFINGIINYILQNDLYNKSYILRATNASYLIDPNFGFSDGLFSGWDENKKAYDKSTWKYQLDENGIPKKDPTLTDPQCVFQIMKKFFSRYDVDTVCNITGTPKDVFLEVAKTIAATSPDDKVMTILYAMGTTQHTYGAQNIRAYAILQLLLGNIGKAGGGINAMRGESNVQGSTDMGLLFHILPGYLPAPKEADKDLATYNKNNTPTTKDPKSLNWWSNRPKYVVSLLKAFYGDNATKDNDFAYSYIPKAAGNYSHINLFEDMYAGKIKGLFLFGQNPAVGGPNSKKERAALEKLEWMVVVDLWETETAAFWYRQPGINPKKIATEVFLLPAASSLEKNGSISNSGRWVQWRYKAVNPPGQAKDDLWIIDQIVKTLKKKMATAKAVFPEPILHLNWNYDDEHGHPDPAKVAQEIHGYFTDSKKLVKNFTQLADDGSTASGCWIYSGMFTEDGKNLAERRDRTDPTGMAMFHNWAWCWPLNRRIIYNRASVDETGKPLDPKRPVIEWKDGKWVGDVPDGGTPPDKNYPFIMLPEGQARLFGLTLADGPFPEHYEPVESPIKNPMSSRQTNPAAFIFKAQTEEYGTPDKYPYVGTTYRVTEHWQAGAMTRNLPWLVELMPDMFVEISPSLAAEKGIKNGDLVTVFNARGSVTAYALVTERIQPLMVNGKKVEIIGLPWHWGFCGLCSGDSANMLTPHAGDANTRIPEYKAFLVDIKKA